jgi:uncharacterized membrane protein
MPPPADGAGVPVVQEGADEPQPEGAEGVEWPCPFCERPLSLRLERCPGCGARALPADACAVSRLAHEARLGYLLQALTPVCLVTALPALLTAYAHRGKARETWLASHFDWQIDTAWGAFWLSLAALAASWVAGELAGAGVGRGVAALAWMGVLGWFLHRVAKGWGHLADDDPVSDY